MSRDYAPLQQPLHQSDADEEYDNVKQLDDDECSYLYLAMQDCIVNSNRDWKACQKVIQFPYLNLASCICLLCTLLPLNLIVSTIISSD